MAFTEQDKQAMDNAATDAENDLTELAGLKLQPIDGGDAIQFVANWWAKWYLKAGHKRLARILLQYKPTEAASLTIDPKVTWSVGYEEVNK